MTIACRRSFTSVGMKATVKRAGFLSSVQDLGRTGFREFGVSTSGALDPFALRVANLLVGNDEGAAGSRSRLAVCSCGLMTSGSSPGAAVNLTLSWITALPAGHVGAFTSRRRIEVPASSNWLPMLACRFPAESMCQLFSEVVPRICERISADLRGAALRDGDEIPLGEMAGGRRPRLQIFPRGVRRTIG